MEVWGASYFIKNGLPKLHITMLTQGLPRSWVHEEQSGTIGVTERRNDAPGLGVVVWHVARDRLVLTTNTTTTTLYREL